MAELYSGEFAFDDLDDAPPQQQRSQGLASSIDAATAAAAASPAPAPAAPPQSHHGAAAPGAPPPMLYIRSERLQQLSSGMSVNADRTELVHSLVESYALLEGAAVDEARPASVQQLLEYHSREYLQALATWGSLSERRRAGFGLEDDCTPFLGLYEYAALIAGGSLQAAAGLASGRHRLAVHLDGGRHHAHKSRAAGFCYSNDVVLAVLQLLGSFKRVLYIDVDVHHGDAVEEAFELTPRVLTLSMHKHAPGFFPGTGASGASCSGAGRGFALNLPLGDGLRDGLFVEAFAELAGGAAAAFRPDAVVLQCGCDGLAHDPLASAWALTPAAYAAVAAQAASWGAPLLLLGGGGYDSPAAAVTWAGVVAALLGRALADDVPAECEHLERFGPAFTLSSFARRMLPADTNDHTAVLDACRGLLQQLQAALERGASGGGQAAAEDAAAAKRPRALAGAE